MSDRQLLLAESFASYSPRQPRREALDFIIAPRHCVALVSICAIHPRFTMVLLWPKDRLALSPAECLQLPDIMIHDHGRDVQRADPSDLLHLRGTKRAAPDLDQSAESSEPTTASRQKPSAPLEASGPSGPSDPSVSGSGQEDSFEKKAVAHLSVALRAGPGGSSDEAESRLLAEELGAAFVRSWGLTPESAQRLRALLAALRSNAGFRSAVRQRAQEAGAAALAKTLALEDPRSWADEQLKAKRAEWQRESLAEAAPQQGGVERPCPECGGRAICETGASQNFKMSKPFTHYRCLELTCGKETHVTE